MARAKMFFDHKNHTYWFEDEAVETQMIRSEREFLEAAIRRGVDRETLDEFYLTYGFNEPIETEAEREELLSKLAVYDRLGKPKRLTKDAAAKKEVKGLLVEAFKDYDTELAEASGYTLTAYLNSADLTPAKAEKILKDLTEELPNLVWEVLSKDKEKVVYYINVA